MTYLIIQTILLIAVAFILGAILGCLLRRFFAADSEPATTTASAAAVGGAAAVGAATTRTARAPHVPTAPVPEVEPTVVPQPIETVAEPAATPVVAEPRTVPVPPAPADADVPEEVPVAEPSVPPAALVGAAGLVGGTVTDDEKPAPAKAKKAPAKPPRKPSKPKTPIASAASTGAEPDNLKLIRGIGPQNEGRLNGIGIDRFAQIAAWTKKDQREMGERLAFPGRIEREEWVAQAKQLAKGKATEFSGRAGSGRVRTSTGTATVSAPGTKPPLLSGARGGKPDNLTLIDGVGNAIERKLFKLGVYHFDQVAAWSEDEGVWVGNEIGFPGRVAREGWIAEAKIFAEGGTTEHARKVERGQIKTSRKSTDDER